MRTLIASAWIVFFSSIFASNAALGQATPGMLEASLKQEGVAKLAEAAVEQGDAKRGAILFHQSYLACLKCHSVDRSASPLGPNLTRPKEPLTVEHIVESILYPSKKIRKGYETVTVATEDGKVVTGLVLRESEESLVIKEAAGKQDVRSIAKNQLQARRSSPNSVMPEGLVNQLTQRQQLLDLVRYVGEIASHGPDKAAELAPPPGSYATRPLPEYEARVDHAGLISSLDRDAFKRGEAIYNRLCINCHGDHQRPGSLPTSLRFASGAFKNGSDPYSMYQTLTRGFGMMQPQMWMVPQQKYDVIHYIREAYLKTHNPTQLFSVEADYIASLPKGDTRGPAPKDTQEWVAMDYGPSLIHSFEVGTGGKNIAYKGIAVRLDDGPGGVSRGRYWMVYDQDTLRMAGAWSGQGFIDWNGIMFNGRHGIHPRVVGDVHVANPTGLGWSPYDSFDAPRVMGRDDKPYGPVPHDWGKFRGLYHHGQSTILAYRVGKAEILESPTVEVSGDTPVFRRKFSIGPRPHAITLLVATAPGSAMTLGKLDAKHRVATLGVDAPARPAPHVGAVGDFRGTHYLEVAKGGDFDLTNRDFSVVAAIQTRKGGAIFTKTAPQQQWVRDGKSLFIRGGRLVYDIGWVGAVQSRRKVDDGKPHNVALVWTAKDAKVRLYIDGKLDGEGTLRPKAPAERQIVRIAYTSSNFPPQSAFQGRIESVRFFQRALAANEVVSGEVSDERVAAFDLQGKTAIVLTRDGAKIQPKRVAHTASAAEATVSATTIDAGLWPEIPQSEWKGQGGSLQLRIPAGDKPLHFSVWMRSRKNTADLPRDAILGLALPEKGEDLHGLTQGGPPRWPQKLAVAATMGEDDGSLAVDVLTRPASNPWLARVRPTGLDFEADGQAMIVSTWDGDIWRVEGIADPSQGLTWRRIASGLFQPLGVKIVDGEVYVTCRDQLCILRDLNDDGEVDFYENFNNDHQVTEHFHEFAMGLQTDDAGNFYYAKSARHALQAVVPHHGTLLKVSKDGSRTEIVATGFRAANGVCINADGTFIVTDQEGHWNPKNRINWVEPGGFYGNMFGYHDVTDSSDSAMSPPLCWITNAFDRSPSELLWLDHERWGPLKGTLLNFSYGYGKVYVVPHERVNGLMQGGMCALAIPRFPTGVMRGRIHPENGALYVCGMFAWAGNQQQPGGVYRIRPTGKPMYAPIGLRAKQGRIEIDFTEPLDPESVNADQVGVRTWSLKRTASYGSKHYDEKPMKVVGAELTNNGKTVVLQLPDVKPTWCMEIRFNFKGVEGGAAEGVIHNTIHSLGSDVKAAAAR